MKYAYPFHIEGNDEDGMGLVVVFPDVYGANTGGFTYKEARSNVEDCLVCALGGYVQMGWDLPVPSPVKEGQELAIVPLLAAAKLSLYTAMRQQGKTPADLSKCLNLSDAAVAKLSLYTAMRQQGKTPADLSKCLNLSDAAVAKLLTPDRHSPLSQVTRALEAVGRKLVVEDKVA
jgi:predicted RNase H-like HicB family nuclease